MSQFFLAAQVPWWVQPQPFIRGTMPKHCQVCTHLDRSIIDARLARHQCNVAALSREYGVGRMAMVRHRREHLSTFLAIYGAEAKLPTLGELHGEYVRLHSAALDALALAEAGTLHAVDADGKEHRRVSPTSIASAIREARHVVDSIARLAADAADEHERPLGIGQGELTQRVSTQLQALMARQVERPVEVEGEEEGAPVLASGPEPVVAQAPGRVAAAAPPPSPPQISLDAVSPLQTPSAILPNPLLEVETSLDPQPKAQLEVQGLSAEVKRVVTQDALSHEHPQDRTVIMTIPNPRYPGSPAASAEERAASGYPDISLTLSDLKARPDLLQRLALDQAPPDPSSTPSP